MVSDDDANTPRCRGVDVQAKILKRATGAQSTCDTAIFEFMKPPCEICHHGVGWVPHHKLVVVERGCEV